MDYVGKVYEDTRQQVHHGDKHATKHAWWTAHGIEVERKKLDFGDYATDGSNVVVDTKASMQEIAQNIGSKQHARFRRECERARDAGYRLVILVENTEGVLALGDVLGWINSYCKNCDAYRRKACDPCDDRVKCPRHKKQKPVQGKRLVKAMATMAKRYGVVFAFCPPVLAARFICIHLGLQWRSICADCYRFKDGLCLPKAPDEYLVGIGPGVQVDGSKALCGEGVPF